MILWPVFSIVALVLMGVGVAIGLVGCAIAAGMVGLGMVSTAVIAGILARRPKVGFRVFLLQCGILAGAVAGACSAWAAQSLLQACGSGWRVLFYGAMGGAFAGTLMALSLDFISRRLHRWASQRFTATRPPAKNLDLDRVSL